MAPVSASITPLMTWTMSVWCSGGCRYDCSAANSSEPGTTPLQWLLRERVLHARRLLEATDMPVEDVACEAGFGTAASLRTHFRRSTATSPLAYRRTFRGRAPA